MHGQRYGEFLGNAKKVFGWGYLFFLFRQIVKGQQVTDFYKLLIK